MKTHRLAGSTRVFPAAMLCLLFAAAPLPLSADDNGTVEGTFWLEDGDNGDRWDVTFRDGVAYSRYDEDMEQDETKIVLSDQMVNRKRMMEELSGDGWWSPHGYRIEVGICEWQGEKKICGLNILLGSSSISTSGGEELPTLAKKLEISDDRIVLHLKTDEPLEFFDDTYGIDVTVDVPLIRIE